MGKNIESKRNHLKRKFKDAETEGGLKDKKLRKERKAWKRALNKFNRKVQKSELRKRWEDR